MEFKRIKEEGKKQKTFEDLRIGSIFRWRHESPFFLRIERTVLAAVLEIPERNAVNLSTGQTTFFGDTEFVVEIDGTFHYREVP